MPEILLLTDCASGWRLRPQFSHDGLHIEHHGRAWMICNASGINIAVHSEGFTLMGDEAVAERALARLSASSEGIREWRS